MTFNVSPLMEREDYLFSVAAEYDNRKGIYFLYQKEELVYIGMSNRSIFKRLNYHIKDKVFDCYRIFELTEGSNSDLSKLEINLINEHRPLYNRQIINPKGIVNTAN